MQERKDAALGRLPCWTGPYLVVGQLHTFLRTRQGSQACELGEHQPVQRSAQRLSGGPTSRNLSNPAEAPSQRSASPPP